MRFIEDLCPPALLYLIFLVVNLGFDISLGMWVTAVLKAMFGVAVVLVLDMFCGLGLTVVSWVLVATPFVITALATAIAMGTSFDEMVFIQMGTIEKFWDKSAKNRDHPADSNAIAK